MRERSAWWIAIGASVATIAGCAASGTDVPDEPSADAGTADMDATGQLRDATRGPDPTGLHWIAGDPHLHHGCDDVITSEQLVTQMVGADLQVGSVLVSAIRYDRYLPTVDGRDDPASQPGHVLRGDMEWAEFAESGDPGHMLILGLSSIRFSDTPHVPRSGTTIADWAHGQGPAVVAGYAHIWAWPETGYPSLATSIGCCTPFELPIQVALGSVAFLSDEASQDNVEDLGARFDGAPLSAGGWAIWKRLENTGYRVAITGGSDIGCLNEGVGRPRTLALIDGEVSYPAFLEAIRTGRTAIASGRDEWLDIIVGGARIGGEIALDAPGEVSVEVRSDSAQARDVEILVNGTVVATVPVDAGANVATVSVQIPQSAWITARTLAVQTSAIYALVGGAPVRASPEDACFLARYVDHLRMLVGRGDVQLGEDEPHAFDLYEQAKADFLQRFEEAGGTSCP